MSSKRTDKIRSLRKLLGARSHQWVAQQFRPALREPVAGHDDQAMLEALVLRTLARPFDYHGLTHPHIQAVRRVAPLSPAGLEIETYSRRTAVILAAHTMGTIEHSGGEVTPVSVRPDTTTPTVDLLLGRGLVRVRVADPRAANDTPLSIADLRRIHPEAEVCARMTSAFGLDWRSDDVDVHGCNPREPAKAIGSHETELARDLSRLLRALPAALGGGRCDFDTWGDHFELAPLTADLWTAWDLVAVLLLFGFAPQRIKKGTRTVALGGIQVSEFHELAGGPSPELLSLADATVEQWDAETWEPMQGARPTPLSLLPVHLERRLSPWVRYQLSAVTARERAAGNGEAAP